MTIRFANPLWRTRLVFAALMAVVAWAAPSGAARADDTNAGDIPARLQTFITDGFISGALAVTADRARVLSVDAVGLADIAAKKPMRADAMFWIASMTKPMTAVAILMLQDEGRLSVSDPVEKYLPEFKGAWLLQEKPEPKPAKAEEAKKNPADETRTLVRPARVITLHDLLTHSSGITDMDMPRPNVTLAEMVMGYARQPLHFPPGSRWEYSNAGINTLGRIVEVVSGKPFERFLDERLLRPLGMKNTTFWPSAAQAKRMAKAYKRPGETGPLEETPVYFIKGEITDRNRMPMPAGGLFATAADVVPFYQMMLNDGVHRGKRLLSSAAVAELTRTQSGDLKTGFTAGMSWGLGFQVVKEPQGTTAMLAPGTFGHGGAFGTQSWADPVNNRIFILLIQRSGANGDDSPLRKAFQEATVAGWGRAPHQRASKVSVP